MARLFAFTARLFRYEADVRDKEKIDLRIDPPPDLIIEVDITHSSMDRLSIYAALRVPEIWRLDAQGLTFLTLNPNGEYVPAAVAKAFSLPITPADLMPFVQMRGKVELNEIIRQFRAWIRDKLAAAQQP